MYFDGELEGRKKLKLEFFLSKTYLGRITGKEAFFFFFRSKSIYYLKNIRRDWKQSLITLFSNFCLFICNISNVSDYVYGPDFNGLTHSCPDTIQF